MERAEEFIEALKNAWTGDIIEYKGNYYPIAASKIGPTSVQKPILSLGIPINYVLG